MAVPDHAAQRRGSWRAQAAGSAPRVGWRRFTRVVGLLLLAALVVAVVAAIVVAPYFRWQTGVVMLVVDQYQMGTLDPVPFAAQDKAALAASLRGALQSRIGPEPVDLTALRSADALRDQLGPQLRRMPLRSKDVLVAYVRGQSLVAPPDVTGTPAPAAPSPAGGEPRRAGGAGRRADAIGGRACFVAEDARIRGARPRELVPLRGIVDAIGSAAPRTTLVALDLGDMQWDPRMGVLANVVAGQLDADLAADRVEARSDTWIIGSHDLFEVSLCCVPAQRTYFARALELALAGRADEQPWGDGNKVVELDEVARFVEAWTGEWVRRVSGGRNRQRPVVWRLGTGRVPIAAIPKGVAIIRVADKPAAKDAEKPRPDAEAEAAPPAKPAPKQAPVAAGPVRRASPEPENRSPADGSAFAVRLVSATAETAAAPAPAAAPATAPSPAAPGPAAGADKADAASKPAPAPPQSAEPSLELVPAPPPKADAATEDKKPDPGPSRPAAAEVAKPAEPAPEPETWDLLDAIGRRRVGDDEAVVDLSRPTPLDYAPHVWRQIFSLAASAELQELAGRSSGSPARPTLDAMAKGLAPLLALMNRDQSRPPVAQAGAPGVLPLIEAYKAAESGGLLRNWAAAPQGFREALATRNDAVETIIWTIDYLGRSNGGNGTPAVEPPLLMALIEQIGRLSATIDREPNAGASQRQVQVDPMEAATKTVAIQRAAIRRMMDRVIDASVEHGSGFRTDASYQQCVTALRNPLLSPARRRAVRDALRTGGLGPGADTAPFALEPTGTAERLDTQPRTLDRDSLRNISALTMSLVALVNAAGFSTDPSALVSNDAAATMADMTQVRNAAVALADQGRDRDESLADVVLLGGLVARMYARVAANAALEAARAEISYVGESDNFGAMLRVMDPRDAALGSQTLLAGLPGWTAPDVVGLRFVVAAGAALSLVDPLPVQIMGSDGRLPPIGSSLRFRYDPADLQVRVGGGGAIAADRPIPVDELPLRVNGLSIDVLANRTATTGDRDGVVDLKVICDIGRRQETATAEFKLPTQRAVNLVARRTPASIEPTLADGWVRAKRSPDAAPGAGPPRNPGAAARPPEPHDAATLALSAIPGRITAWELGLENLAEIPRTVSVEIHDVSGLLPAGGPAGGLRHAEAIAAGAALLEGTSAPPLALVPKVELPVGDGVTALLIPPEPAPAGPQPLPAPKADPGGDAAAAPKPIGPHLAIIVREQTPGEPRRAWVNHVHLQVEHPATRIAANATWIREDRTISVKVDAVDDDGRAARLPPDGIRATLAPLTTATRLGKQNIAIRKGEIVVSDKRPSDTAVAAWNGSDRDGRAWLALDVEGYPRAFVFGVDCSPPAAETPQKPQNDWRNIDWLDLAGGETLIKAPAATIPLAMAVDAPPDAQATTLSGTAAGDGQPLVSLSLREIHGGGVFREQARVVWTGDSDRQVTFTRQKPSGPVALAVRADVGDWRVAVPGQGYENVDVEAEARLVLPGEQQPLVVRRRFVFDARPPTIEIPAAVNVVVGRPLVIPVRVLDDPRESFAQAPGTHLPGVSGVQRVDWAIDAKGDGKPEAWLPAVGIGGGMYELRVTTTTVPPGRQTPLLVRATDRVGLANEPLRIWLDAAPIVARNSIEGRVTLKGRGEEGVTVTADGPGAPKPTRSGKDGTFRFADLEPGDYKLRAQGAVRNQTYRSEVSPVTVAAPPAPASSVTLELK